MSETNTESQVSQQEEVVYQVPNENTVPKELGVKGEESPENAPKKTGKQKSQTRKPTNLPSRGRSAWQIFVSENVHGTTLNKDVMSDLSQKFKSLTTEEMDDLKDRSQRSREDAQNARQEIINKMTSKEIFEENLIRKERRAKGIKKNSKPIKDPSEPKKPLSSFLYFTQKLRQDPEFKQKLMGPAVYSITEFSKKAGEVWKSLSDDIKAPFIEDAATRRAQYKEEYEKWRKDTGIDQIDLRDIEKKIKKIHEELEKPTKNGEKNEADEKDDDHDDGDEEEGEEEEVDEVDTDEEEDAEADKETDGVSKKGPHNTSA
ncbi:mismatch-binding protein cmb1 [Schizosaccharomyces japonicus yFS275]|uniref:Mismatch-binding protein cmb1 n=1 Tax=Schizosaccharomyces japonicus (strain yFS275 / FY16936) TaxID=402676 RepID=B6K0K1_SCHJY|nr:mismatch-binding protein cmb1 [Schizosaccharomyces japonicus yFS275]EEB07472.1 mismatch-binding protein cmb1 [Schizosaccharomyces japonicus yFS275]